jgi:hypothetical protein
MKINMNLNLAISKITPNFLKQLSDEELIVFADMISSATGEEILKDSDREQAIENKMAKDLNDDYLDDLIPISEKEVGKLPLEDVEMSEVNDAMVEIGKSMDKRSTSEALKIITGALTVLAGISRKSQTASIKQTDPNVSVSASFSQADLAAIEEMSKQQLWWIGDLWNDHLSRVITETVQHESLITGLGREQVGQILKGVVNGTVEGAFVPGTWRGSTEQYFQMLSGTARTRASAFGALTSIRDVGFDMYRIVAVMDERTSDQCRLMHNKVFKVSDGASYIKRSLAATDPNEYKSVAGWKSASEIEQLIGSGDEESQRMSLASSGLALPPYHARCRTIIMAVT